MNCLLIAQSRFFHWCPINKSPVRRAEVLYDKLPAFDDDLAM